VDSERIFWSVLLIIGLTWMLLWVFFVAPTLMHVPTTSKIDGLGNANSRRELLPLKPATLCKRQLDFSRIHAARAEMVLELEAGADPGVDD
jgi:hypothetical protein